MIQTFRSCACWGALSLLVSLSARASEDGAPKPLPGPPAGATAQLTVLETTDLHSHVLSYDYLRLAEDASLGFERTATLIRQARREGADTLLIDNGDTIQGTALADHQALVAPPACERKLAIYQAMDALGFDAGTLGNHEFNYGLLYLARVTGTRFNVDGLPEPAAQPRCSGPDFPLVLANVTSRRDGQPLYKPYVLLDKAITARDAEGRPFRSALKIAVIGFTPPPILSWDKRWLDGRIDVQGVVETAAKFVPMARAEGADLVIAASHGGFDPAPYSPAMENANLHLAKVPGIDGILMGHSHAEFPNPACATRTCHAAGVDKVRGTLHGVPAVMPGYWGKALGRIAYSLVARDGRWTIDAARTVVSLRRTQDPLTRATVAADPAIAPLVQAEHRAAIDHAKTPIGRSDFRLSTYFTDVGDVSAIQVVNAAQADYVAKYIAAHLPQHAHLPVLSVSAPFRSGFAGAHDFTDVAPGALTVSHAADLYLYPNTLQAVKVSGAELRAWLERAAERFNRIDPALATEQKLVSGLPGYGFDLFTAPELSYEIDVTRARGERIRALRHRGAPLDPGAEFIVATNNFRASGGAIPALDGSRTILAAPDANRDVLIAYIRARRTLARSADGSTRSWRFTPVLTRGPVVFSSAPGKLPLAIEAGLTNIRQLRDDDGSGKGLAVYAIDLSK